MADAVANCGDGGGAAGQGARLRRHESNPRHDACPGCRSETPVLSDDPPPPEPVPPTPLPPTPQNPQGVPPAIDDPRGPVDPAPVREPPRHSPPAIAAR